MIDYMVECEVHNEDETKYFKEFLFRNKVSFLMRGHIPSSLLHIDIWVQNILINERGDIAEIKNWDPAFWGNPKIELSVLDYCSIFTPSFWEGYGDKSENSIHGWIRTLFYLLHEHQEYISINIWRRYNRLIARKYKKESLAIFPEIEQLIRRNNA
ncbi:MAG: fructosamine kinase family protein [Promethearchaeota archaeon]